MARRKKPTKKQIDKTAEDIMNSPAADQLGFKKIYVARERQKEELEKDRSAPPSYEKRKAESKKKAKEKLKVSPGLKTFLKKFGAKGKEVQKKHSGYYAAVAAKALLKLGADPKAHYTKTEVRKDLIFMPLPGGWYSVRINGELLHKQFRFKEVQKLQWEQNRRKKLEQMAKKIGTTPAAIEKILREIKKTETAKTRRFKQSKKFKELSSKKRKAFTIKRRMQAVLGAMTDLLEVYGSPKALRDRKDNDPDWKKINGVWAVKEGRVWLEKLGPDHWRRVRVRRKKK